MRHPLEAPEVLHVVWLAGGGSKECTCHVGEEHNEITEEPEHFEDHTDRMQDRAIEPGA